MHKTKSYLYFVSWLELPIAHPAIQPREKLQKLQYRSSCKWTYSRGFFDVIHVILTTRSHDKWLRSVATEYLIILLNYKARLNGIHDQTFPRSSVSIRSDLTLQCVSAIYNSGTTSRVYKRHTCCMKLNQASNDMLGQSVEDA